jgi:hypothetical protein
VIAEVIRVFGVDLEVARVTAIHDDQIEAELVFDGGTRVSARISDAVAVALHLRVPIEVVEPVLEQAGLTAVEILIGDTAEADMTGDAQGTNEVQGTDKADETVESEVERFRRLLETASPEDFDLGDFG